MKKRLLCLSLIFAMTAAQVMPVSAARKDDLQAEKSATQSKLSEAESKASSLESKKNALMGQIDSTQQELVSVISQIEILDEDIKEKEAENRINEGLKILIDTVYNKFSYIKKNINSNKELVELLSNRKNEQISIDGFDEDENKLAIDEVFRYIERSIIKETIIITDTPKININTASCSNMVSPR